MCTGMFPISMDENSALSKKKCSQYIDIEFGHRLFGDSGFLQNQCIGNYWTNVLLLFTFFFLILDLFLELLNQEHRITTIT